MGEEKLRIRQKIEKISDIIKLREITRHIKKMKNEKRI